MAAAVSAFILMFSTLWGSRGVLSTPTNVRLTSHNLNLVLRWDPPDRPISDLLYTTEYNMESIQGECGHSWGQIAPPGWKATRLPWTEIDPVFRISAFRSVYHLATYNITYWKAGQKEKYCVQVQINTGRNPNHSVPSAAVCESTTIEEEAPWVAAVVTFVVMAMAVAVVVVAVVYRKRISHFLCPKDALPQHFKEYLLAPPNSSMYLDMRNSRPPKEVFDPVSIVADGSTLEEGLPLEAAGTSCSKQPDTT
ncbi:hypothetical protein FQN60_001640 [Etheostoma spectabile]|uniref:Fibronectin type-III domain-containing protein n=1 Tax=Etheostoma spectabile TaxID=54343 RepID=A0A5J5D739_9PERO|nr:hypothetical protein FQN60_001640 [Etheostoma spectabile]